MKIVVVGTGYVGLVTGACLAEVGTDVTCVDVDEKKIDNLRNGILPIYEPGLDVITIRNYKKGRLKFSTRLQDVIPGADIVFIAVGTPPGEDGSADLKYVIQVAESVGRYMDEYLVIATKSTVPVGTAAKVKATIAEVLKQRGKDIPFDVASNPEFLKEGAAVDDFLKPDRIIIGAETERARQLLRKLYDPFVLNGHPVLFMDVPSAEMTKYAANAMLATKISFMNDIANLCDLLGANINEVRKGIGADPRIGTKFIYPGIGFGGSCFPKDVKALVKTGQQKNYNLRILAAVDAVNEDQKKVMISKIMHHFNGDISGKTFTVWGLAFKPNTDDMREAPSLVIIDALIKAGAQVKAYDPVAMQEAKHVLPPEVQLADDAVSATQGADAVILVTEWAEFRLPDWDQIAENMKQKVLFDGRNIYNPTDMKARGFSYYGIGIR